MLWEACAKADLRRYDILLLSLFLVMRFFVSSLYHHTDTSDRRFPFVSFAGQLSAYTCLIDRFFSCCVHCQLAHSPFIRAKAGVFSFPVFFMTSLQLRLVCCIRGGGGKGLGRMEGRIFAGCL